MKTDKELSVAILVFFIAFRGLKIWGELIIKLSLGKENSYFVKLSSD